MGRSGGVASCSAGKFMPAFGLVEPTVCGMSVSLGDSAGDIEACLTIAGDFCAGDPLGDAMIPHFPAVGEEEGNTPAGRGGCPGEIFVILSASPTFSIFAKFSGPFPVSCCDSLSDLISGLVNGNEICFANLT